jgi:hypothetical protein
MKKNLYHRILIFALLPFLVSLPVSASEATAFQLVKEGNRYVGEDSKDQVVQIRSDKSINGMTPNIWYVVYYDPDATFHATEVKFGGGKKMEVKRPMRVLEFGNTAEKRLNMKKLNIDSDKALSIAIADPLLKGLTLKASQFWLEHGDNGPMWKVRLWAARPRNTSEDVNIGEIYVQADEGAVTRRDLHIDRLD